MNLLGTIYNRFVVPRFLVNSMPKAGTNLLGKAVTLFSGIRSGRIHIGQSTLAQFRPPGQLEGTMVPIGIERPQLASLGALRQSLQRMKPGQYATGHIPFSDEMAGLLGEIGMKSLLILRDPRDVVVSHAYYVTRAAGHFLHEFYQTLSESERLMKSITGVKQTASNDWALLNIYERYRSLMPWRSHPVNYTTCFEKLVGPQGNGCHDVQIGELKNIAGHLGLKHDSRDIKEVADRLFGGTSTFRKGVSGDWRNHFAEEHKRAFKEIAGQLLIDLDYERDFDW